MRKLLPLIMMFWCWSLFAQPITTFPYVENFDAFPSGTQGSVAEPNPNAFPGGWINEQAGDDPQDWYSVSGSTPSGITGPTGDHTTGSGIYLYVEDSGGGANNDSVDLLSPQFDITSLANPTMSVWIHSLANTVGANFGGDSSLNDLKIDVLYNGVWNELDSIGDLATGWSVFFYNLSAYPGIVQFRFRVNNNNFGDFVHDIAIDDFSVFNQLDFDADLQEAKAQLVTPTPYTLAPVSQSPGYQFNGSLFNNGSNPITQVKVKATFGTFVDSVIIDTIQSLSQESFATTNTFSPSQAITGQFEVSIAETDGDPGNNIRTVTLVDSTFARDDSAAEGGIGFTGATGRFGNMFELSAPDVLTSSSVFLNSSTIGDQIRIFLYGFGNEVANVPDTVALDSTGIITITSLGWNTLSFPCPVPLDAGRYFIAIEQINTNNLGVGYDINNYLPGTAYFGDGLSPWVDFATLPPSLHSAVMIRMNFGPTPGSAAITTNQLVYCLGDTVNLSSTGNGSFVWGGPNILSTNGSVAQALPDTTGSFFYTVLVQNAIGCLSTDTAEIRVNPNPQASISGDTLICTGDTAMVMASGGVSYLWNTGDTGASIPLPVNANTTVSVTVTDINGCEDSDTLDIVAAPLPSLTTSSTYDSGAGDGTATASVSGGTPPYVYVWDDPNNQTDSTATNLPAGTYRVTVTDANGCSVSDTVVVDLFVSIGADIIRGSFAVYPNPASDQLVIQSLNGFGLGVLVEITLSDLSGKVVLHRKVITTEKIEIGLPVLADGLYQLELRGEKARGIKRISIRQ